MDRATLAVLALAAAACGAKPPPPVAPEPSPPISAAPPPPVCSAVERRACDELGMAALARGERAVARRLFQTGCDAHHGPSCTHLGEMAQAAHEWQEAARRFNEACSADDPPGCAQLARVYYGGRGVWANPDLARQLAVKACDAGEASICAQVGEWFARGIAGPRDDT